MLHGSIGRLVSTLNLHPPTLFLLSKFARSISLSTYQTQFITPPIRLSYNELLDYFDHLLRQSNSIQQSIQIHTQIIVTGCCQSGFLAARLISVYSRFGLIFDARKVFETTPSECKTNLLLWNSLLRANSRRGYYEENLRLYLVMKNHGISADGFTFPLIIKTCASIGGLKLCKNIHTHVLQMGLQNHLHVVNELLGMYGKLGRLDTAEKLFDRMPVRGYISWNTMVSGFAHNYDCHRALETFRRMEVDGLEPNVVTWTCLLSSHSRCGHGGETLTLFGSMRRRGIEANAESLAVVLSTCTDLVTFVVGQIIHGFVIKCGFEEYLIVKNSLICLYGKHGDVEDAKKLFLEMEMKNIVSWNSLVAAYSESGLCDEALEIFSQLEKSDECTTMRPNVITWTAIICGFACKGQGEEALELFRRMQLAKVKCNTVTICSVLSVCAELAALSLGRELHAQSVKALIDGDILVGNGLINMYTKCGSVKGGRLVFEKIDHDLISWNSMISGYGIHGYGDNALETFDQMINEELKPDKVTFIAILSACAHAGRVAEGRELFNKMAAVFGVQPEMEHYACMVDLLSRAGLIEEASKMVKNMPMKPNAFVWGSLLNSTRVCKNAELAEETASNIFSLETKMTGSYMLLSNIYAASGRWDDSARVRLSARTNGLTKTPGQSWIEIKKRVYVFSSGKAVMDLEEIYWILEDLCRQMEIEGYAPDKSFVLQDVDEDEKIDIE
ncbi:hypothetical protein Nepgr_005599 [Nepenthes gracilis]|uniref:Pentatricopeptide repeat-containing protein n=1 Tax=Nepenthes gracilis TaxID=150966 RepID=A0AAD3S3G6_NEPGR|nr:hypothetical protein Nepgr_005599 [Nepenthes gracilis]